MGSPIGKIFIGVLLKYLLRNLFYKDFNIDLNMCI